MLHGPQNEAFDLSFSVPAVCADRLESGEADIGLVPCAELERLNLTHMPEVGIACRGPVRSILLLSKVVPERIRTLAADASSRTSVALTRIVLERRYGVRPEMISMPPNAERMLAQADAALIIGDPALRLKPEEFGCHMLDLGAEWVNLTGLPMVFAVWAGRAEAITAEAGKVLLASCRYGLERIEEIAKAAPASHGVPEALAREYLTRHIVFELGAEERRGLEQFQTFLRAGALVP